MDDQTYTSQPDVVSPTIDIPGPYSGVSYIADPGQPPPPSGNGYKIPPVRIPLDGFTLKVQGITYQPHKGEWVDAMPWAATVTSSFDTVQLQAGLEKQDAQMTDRGLDGMIAFLAEQIADWSVRDAYNKPLPVPIRVTPTMTEAQRRAATAVIRLLHPKLITWLYSELMGGETEGEGSGV